MDLAAFAFADTATMTVRDPVSGEDLMNKDKPVTITVAGMDSAIYKAVRREALNKRLSDTSGRKAKAEDVEKMTIAGLAKCTVAWSGIVFNGKELPCDAEHAASLYAKADWLRQQVDAFMSERANFLPASPQG